MWRGVLVVLCAGCSAGDKDGEATGSPDTPGPTDDTPTNNSDGLTDPTDSAPTPTETATDTATRDTSTTATADTADTGSTTDTDDSGLVGPACTAEVTQVSVSSPSIDTMVELAVTLDTAAAAAAWCQSDLEPEQVFFSESTDIATDHTVRLAGLIAGHSYTCTVVPVCEDPTLAVGTSAQAAWNAGRPPNAVQRLTVTQNPKIPSAGYWTVAPTTISMFGGTAYVVIWGPEGRPRWWMALPNGVGMWIEARHHLEDDKLVWGGGMDPDGRMRVVDLWDGETYAFAPQGWQQDEFHHDGKRIDDGRLMSLEIRANQLGQNSWDGFGVRVVDPATDLVEVDIDSQTLVDAGDLPPGGGFNQDPWHANWMEYKETKHGPRVYVSLCFDFSIVVIDATTGQLDYRFGRNEGWTLLDAQGAPLSENVLPQCQHGVEIDGDRWLIYDNGQDRSYSSAQEWTVDPDTMTATLEWSWTEPGWHEEYLGDIDWLGDDHVLLTAAPLNGSAELIEVDKVSGDVVNRMVFDGGALTYRSERYDGCRFFDSTLGCPATAERHEAIEALLP